MSLFRGLIMLALILIALAHFFPESYNSAREWVVEKVSHYTTDGVGNGIGTVTNFAKIPQNEVNDFKCYTAKDCVNRFNITGLSCSTIGTCYVEVPENGTNSTI